MRAFDSGRVQDKLVNRLDRQERQQTFRRDRFFRYKLEEIHNRLTQTLLMAKVIETDNPAAVSDSILAGLKKAARSTEFDFKFFIAPRRDLVPRPNPYSLYMTQYVLEVLVNDGNVIDVYGSDIDIYKLINGVIMDINMKFDKSEEEVRMQLANNKALLPGSRDYEIAFEQLIRKKVGEPYKFGLEESNRFSKSSR
ncbi:MAG: DUF507 family protein [Desulfobacteraceae bacterium]|jgi:hypothetical protein|nr:MAG: DUF507 family protein [Desulfobacteraceae bacterium]